MRFLAVLKWALAFLVLTAVITGGAGFWVIQHGNDWIRQQILAEFDRTTSDLELHFDRLQLLSTNAIRLTGLELRDRARNRVVLRAASVQIVLEESLLLERQKVVVRDIHAIGIDVLLRRTAEGTWNWQEYRFAARPVDQPLIPPSVVLEKLRASIQLHHGDDIPQASLLVSTPLLQAVPSSGETYEFAGYLSLPGTGDLLLSGECDLKQLTWSLGGRVQNVVANQSLLEIVRSTAPGLTENLQQLDSAMAYHLPRPTPVQKASAEQATAAIVIGDSGVSPRFHGVMDVDFLIERRPESPVTDLRLKVDVRDGQISSPVIPLKFTDVRAKFFWSNSDVRFELINARDGDALITGVATIPMSTASVLPKAVIHLENFPITHELKPFFSEKSQRFFDHFQPAGKVSGDVELRRFPSGVWLPVMLKGQASEVSLLFHRFRYPISDVTATIEQQPLPESASSLQDVVFDFLAAGDIGGKSISAKGLIRNPGPAQELQVDIVVPSLIVDGRFRNALDEKIRRPMENINLSGVASGTMRCTRAPGLDQPIQFDLAARLEQGRIRFRNFPFDVEDLTGRLEYRSPDRRWNFSDLSGRHKTAKLTGEGSFRGLPEPGELQLSVRTENAELGPDLYNALPESSRSVWRMINPEGRVDLTTHIAWTADPEHKPVIQIDDVHVYDAQIYPRPFPLRMNIRSARLSYDPNDPQFAGTQHCTIHSLHAEHDGAEITASGWATLDVDRLWQLHLNDVNAIDLQPDDSLRAALPESWRENLSRLSPAGRVSLESSELDFRGIEQGDAPATAAWNATLRMKECEINAGLDLKRVSGIVRARGTWDGYQLLNAGSIRLDRAEVLDMIVAGINGPYTMTDQELVLGNRDVILGKTRPRDVPAEERIQAQTYGGSLEMDAQINLRAGSRYRFFAELRNALLEAYAARHLSGQPNLRGVVNSWIFVEGSGESSANLTGKGQLQINPAALYEVPVVLEMLSALNQLNFTVPDRTAFRFALMSFEIRDRTFVLDPVDLVGDALSLRGRGSISFAGDVVLDFFSRPPRPRGIPLAGVLPSLATQWVNVKVRGSINNPHVNVRNRIKIDDSLRQFLVGQPNPEAPIPGLSIPAIFGFQAPPPNRLNTDAPPNGP